MLTALAVLLAELAGLAAAPAAGAQEVKPPLTVDGPGPCRRIGGEWLQPGYCELTGPLRVAPDDTLVLAVGAFLLGPVEVEGGLEVRGPTSLVFFFGDLANRGRMAVLDGGVAYVAGRAESPGAVELSGGGRMEILSDSGSLAVTGRLNVAGDGRLDVYGAFDNRGLTANLGILAVWCSGSQLGLAPQGVAAQVQDCSPPEVSLVSRTPADSSGWNRGTVTVVWACTDDGSGVVTERVAAVLSGDGAEQSAFGVCTDLAGNTATGVVTGINIERPAPRTRRRPAPPVVVHLDPAAPAPPPPAPPAAAPPVTPAVPPVASPDTGPLPGPALTDPVSSPDPGPVPLAPGPPMAASTTSTSGPTTAAPTITAPSTTATVSSATVSLATGSSPTVPATGSSTGSAAAASTTAPTASPTSPSAAASPGATTAGTGAAVGAAATSTTARLVTSVASPTTTSSLVAPPVTDRAAVPTTTAAPASGTGPTPSTAPRKASRPRPIRRPRPT